MLGLRSIFLKQQPSFRFRFSQRGNMWRMFFSRSGIIAGETRDTLSKNAYFFALNSTDGRIIFSNLQLEQKWWVSISGVNDGFAFISGYKKPDMPELMGITAIHLLDGSIRWESNDLSFFFADNDRVYVCKQLLETKKYYSIDANTGRDRKEVTVESIVSRKEEVESSLYQDFIYPEPDQTGLIDLSGLKHEGPVEYIKFKGYIIYNYHEYKGVGIRNVEKNRLTNKLLIRDSASDKIVFSETLNKNVTGYVPDSFFIRKDCLFYVREKRELVCVSLPG